MSLPASPATADLGPIPGPPREPYARLFARFLRFGALAWGGPVAQIDMIRKDLVEDERWISRTQFNRVLAVYQALPGPEAHELCVYFGTIARGRLGGVLAGLGFMLPGFVLMLALSWWYVTFGIAPGLQGAFAGAQAAVVALIVRAVHRIGGHALTDRWLWVVAVLAAAATWLNVHFALVLPLAGLAYVLARRHPRVTVAALALAVVLGAVSVAQLGGVGPASPPPAPTAAPSGASVPALAASGLRAGLLTFGGAYTVIPFLQRDAVVIKGWMTAGEFLDGIALSGMLPAPLIIFATFIGYVVGALGGAVAITAAIFAPAFAFTLVGHELIERVVEHRAIRRFLEGVTAGVIGMIGVTTLTLFRAGVESATTGLIFVLAVLLLFRWRSKAAVPVAVIGSALLGAALLRG